MTAHEALARRAVACPRWRWMPGMHAKYPMLDAGVVLLVGKWVHVSFDSELAASLHGHDELVPDLTDPATLGCLLALVREVYGSPHLYCRLSSTTRASDGIRAWEVNGYLDASRSPDGRGGSFRGWGYASEAEALVATLEFAP